MTDIVRVLRIIEYTGLRHRVEETVARSVNGTRVVDHGLTIRGATIGMFPEVLESHVETPQDVVPQDVEEFLDKEAERG
jgi:hypothetical protein